MKIWDKGIKLEKEIEKFTVGNDILLDKKLVKYDCLASIAHAKMLKSINLLDSLELNKLISGLNEIIQLNSEGKFILKQQDEDCHTAIENFLISKFGELGKKIHTGRSRNDQVLTAIRLYQKEELLEIKKLSLGVIREMETFINLNGNIEIPGYTHMQKAMPTNVKTWIGSFKDSMKDNILLLDFVITLVDQNPLGSAAGFGVPVFKIDKTLTAKELNFSKVMKNPMYCQLSRGKFAGQIVNVISSIMFDLNKLATDLLLFSMKEFGFIKLPTEFCTGSSIMPQKKNPDVLELLKAKYYVILGEEFKIKSLITNLMSGYNRDVQLTKEPLMNSVDIVKQSLAIASLVVSNIQMNEKKCSDAMSDELYATEEAYKLVEKGMPFREAYKVVGKKYI